MICHNDICIENLVFSEGRAAGLLDFDFAAPGRPVWDLVMAARYWVPLMDPTSAAATGRVQLDPFRRSRVLADAYGADTTTRRQFSSVLLEADDVGLRFVLRRVAANDVPFVRMWDELGGARRHARRRAWLEGALPRLEAELTA